MMMYGPFPKKVWVFSSPASHLIAAVILLPNLLEHYFDSGLRRNSSTYRYRVKRLKVT